MILRFFQPGIKEIPIPMGPLIKQCPCLLQQKPDYLKTLNGSNWVGITRNNRRIHED